MSSPVSQAELSRRISHLQAGFAEACRTIEASKQCDGCSFFDSIIDPNPGVSDCQDFAQIKNKFSHVQLLLGQAAKCKGVDLQGSIAPKVQEGSAMNSMVSTSTIRKENAGSKKRRSSVDHPTQTSPVKRARTASQTDVSADFFEEIDQFRKRFKENDASHARWSLQQLLKFSATEREREELEGMVRFTKLFFGMNDEEFGNIYKKYSSGCGLEELRNEWTERNKPKESTPERQKFDFESPKSDQNESLEDEVFAAEADWDKNKIMELRRQLRASKILILQLFKILDDTVEVETSSQESVSRLLGTVSHYTDMLNERRHSV